MVAGLLCYTYDMLKHHYQDTSHPQALGQFLCPGRMTADSALLCKQKKNNLGKNQGTFFLSMLDLSFKNLEANIPPVSLTA